MRWSETKSFADHACVKLFAIFVFKLHFFMTT